VRRLIGGWHVRVVFDTLENPSPLNLETVVPAIGFDVKCGEVLREKWSFNVTESSGGFNLNVSTSQTERTVGA